MGYCHEAHERFDQTIVVKTGWRLLSRSAISGSTGLARAAGTTLAGAASPTSSMEKMTSEGKDGGQAARSQKGPRHVPYKPKITIFALAADTGNARDRVPATNATRCLPSTIYVITPPPGAPGKSARHRTLPVAASNA
jgi:hypothetical protein